MYNIVIKLYKHLLMMVLYVHSALPSDCTNALAKHMSNASDRVLVKHIGSV